jgi:hypothetical protein
LPNLNPICHLLALEAHHILQAGSIRVKISFSRPLCCHLDSADRAVAPCQPSSYVPVSDHPDNFQITMYANQHINFTNCPYLLMNKIPRCSNSILIYFPLFSVLHVSGVTITHHQELPLYIRVWYNNINRSLAERSVPEPGRLGFIKSRCTETRNSKSLSVFTIHAHSSTVGWDSSGSIATRYRLDGP